jgi:hypothetical protein
VLMMAMCQAILNQAQAIGAVIFQRVILFSDFLVFHPNSRSRVI